MNAARVAALLRELAAEFDAVPAPPKSKPQRKKRVVELVPPPDLPFDPLAEQAAHRLLTRNGYRKKD